MHSFTQGLNRRAFLAGLSFFSAVITLLFFNAPAALGKKKKPEPPPASTAGLPSDIETLGRQLLSTPLDESDALTSQVQQLVLDHVQDWLAKNPAVPAPDGTPFDVRVRREIESAFSKLHYPVFGQAHAFSQAWNGGVLTGCGYTLGWSDFDRANVVALFETREGKTRLVGADHFVQRTDLHFEIMPSLDPAGFRFLAYGISLGKSQPRLSAALYGFDGQSLKSLWQTRDVYDGKLDVEKGTVTIRYLKEEEYIHELTYNRKPPRHMAIYKSSPQGLTLESDREIPF
jgi:hypothetical protein